MKDTENDRCQVSDFHGSEQPHMNAYMSIEFYLDTKYEQGSVERHFTVDRREGGGGVALYIN